MTLCQLISYYSVYWFSFYFTFYAKTHIQFNIQNKKHMIIKHIVHFAL